MVAGHKVERDELRMQIDSLCHEVAAIPAIKAERDALMSAGKMALDALVAESRTTESNVTLVRILTAITSLRQAGVQ